MRARKNLSKRAILRNKNNGTIHDKRYDFLLKEKCNGIYFGIYQKSELKKVLKIQYYIGLVKVKSHHK